MPQMVVLGDWNDFKDRQKVCTRLSTLITNPILTNHDEFSLQGLQGTPDGTLARGKSPRHNLDLDLKIQSAADSDEENVVRSNLQKMSTAAVDEMSSEKVISTRPRPFRPEAPHCNNCAWVLTVSFRQHFSDCRSRLLLTDTGCKLDCSICNS